ncbi:hypothetical protein FGB62_68g023 [Gracilaria domingensis]|nr:hypothetical protein FGB62_68g023 [Gracilaria domingensis]
MGNTVSRSHIRDAERGVARTTRENTRRNAVPVPVPSHQPPSLSSTSTELQPSDFHIHQAPRSISFPDHSVPPVCSPHDAHRLRLQAATPSSIPIPVTKRRARHVSADIPLVSPVPQATSPSARSNSAQDSLIAIAPAQPPLLDPSLSSTAFSLCHAARTHSPPRVDKPPRARKVVSFNENVRVVTYPCDNSSGYSSGGEQASDGTYSDKARRKRGRSVFRLLHRVSGFEPEPTGCFSGQYDACCGLLNTAADSAYQDSPAQPQVSQTRRLDYQSPKQPQHAESDRLSYTTKNRKVSKPSAEAYPLAESDAVIDDFDYTIRQDSLNEPSNLSQAINPFNEHPIPEAANRSNSSFDISPLWQRLKHVDELDDIDHSRRTSPPRISDPDEDDEVRPVPQPSVRLKRSRQSKTSSISHSRSNRPLPKPSRSSSASAQTKTQAGRQKSKRSVPNVDVDGIPATISTGVYEDTSRQSLSTPELETPGEIRKTKSLESSVKHADKSAFPRSASASKPPLPRSRSSACESEPSFAALQVVNHKSASFPSSSDRPGILVQIRGSDRMPNVDSQFEKKSVPSMSSEDPLASKKPPLPNRRTSQLAEEKKTFMQAIAVHTENALQIPTDETTHTILPVPQSQANIRDTFEKGSQTANTVTKRIKSDEVRHEVEIKPDAFGALSSPLTPDSKTEKSFSFKSLQSVGRETIGASGQARRSSEAQETLSSQVSRAFNRRSRSGTSSSQTHEKFADISFEHTKSDSMITAKRTNEVHGYRERGTSQTRNAQEYGEHGSEQHSSATLAGLSDIQTTHVEEQEVPRIDDSFGSQVAVDPGHALPDASLTTSSDIENSAPSTGNLVPTVVDPNAAEPVSLSSKSFRSRNNRISANLRYTYAEDESLTFSALNEEDQLVNEPVSKLSIPKVRSGISSSPKAGNCEDVDIFEAANRAAVDINALVEQSKENDSAVGSLDGLDLEPAVMPGDDDYSVAPISPIQNFTPVAGIYYGNSSLSEEAMSPEEVVSDKVGVAEYPEYEVLRVGENENEDSVFGSEPNTPVSKENSGWRDARPKRSRDLSEQVRDSVAVQLASLSSIHGGRGAGDRTTGKMVPEVLLRDWSGNTPIEPTVEVFDSAPNSRSSAAQIFRTDRFPRDIQGNNGTYDSRPGNTSNAEVRDRLQGVKDRLFRVSTHSTDEWRSTQDSAHARHGSEQFSTPGFPRGNIGEVIPEDEGSTAADEGRANGRLSHSMPFERGSRSRGNGRSRTFEPALPKAFAVDPVLQDFQVPVTRKSLSEAGGRRRGLDQNTAFVDEESYAGNTRNVRKADLGFKPPSHNERLIHLPSNHRQTSDMEHGASAAREDTQAFRNVVGRLVNRMQSAKRMLSTS